MKLKVHLTMTKPSTQREYLNPVSTELFSKLNYKIINNKMINCKLNFHTFILIQNSLFCAKNNEQP
jgi:hypothetical protein